MQETQGIRANGYHSYQDFGLMFAVAPVLSSPAKKRITASVPYSHGILDFTGVYGQTYFETRTLEVVWQLDASDQIALEDKRSEVENWLAGIDDTDFTCDIFDGYHFRGSCSEVSVEYEEYGDFMELTVTFEVYPFLIADTATTTRINAGTTTIRNSGWPVQPSATPVGSQATITIGNISQTITGETALSMALETGDNAVTVKSGAIDLTFTEERL